MSKKKEKNGKIRWFDHECKQGLRRKRKQLKLLTTPTDENRIDNPTTEVEHRRDTEVIRP